MTGWYLNLKAQTRLLLAFSVITILATSVTAWLAYTALQLNHLVEDAAREAKELYDVQEVQVFLLEEELAQQNYRLTGESQYLARYEQAEESADISLRSALLDAATPEERDFVKVLSDEKETYNRAFDEVIELHEAGNLAGALELANEVAAAEEERVERIHQQVEHFGYQRVLDLQEVVDGAWGRTRTIIIVGAVAMVLFCSLAILASWVTNQVTEPILHLTNAVVAFENRVYEPELLLGYAKRREELGKLARAFNSMVASIQLSTALKDRLLAATSRFVPLHYLDFLEKTDIAEIRLGDHVSAEMAVMFSDVRSFTTLSESMTPQQNFDFVNSYLQRVSPAIQRRNGFIVKFLGDGMMAVFPYSVEDAVQAGIDKIAAVNAFNAEREQYAQKPIDLGVGIHTGHMMVGMIGEEGRMQGDAFSDNVNLTSRLEGLTKHFGVSMIISAETLARLEEPGKYRLRPLGRARVKGRETPIGLYEVFDADGDELRAAKEETLADYQQAVQRYQMGDLAGAQRAFRAVLARFPDDKACHFYLEQIETVLREGKPEYWDGVLVMTAK